jgi:hypothetical protein
LYARWLYFLGRTSENPQNANFALTEFCEVRTHTRNTASRWFYEARIHLPRTPLNKGSSPLLWDTKSLFGVEKLYRGKEYAPMSEQARKVENKAIPEWAQGLYYNSGLMKEVLVYHDDEAIYFEHKGKESGVVRFTFEMIEGLKIVEDEAERDGSPQHDGSPQ